MPHASTRSAALKALYRAADNGKNPFNEPLAQTFGNGSSRRTPLPRVAAVSFTTVPGEDTSHKRRLGSNAHVSRAGGYRPGLQCEYTCGVITTRLYASARGVSTRPERDAPPMT